MFYTLKKTKHEIKVLTYLVKIKGRLIVPIFISENISLKFLKSILLTLRENGFLGYRKTKVRDCTLQVLRNTTLADLIIHPS